MISHEDLDQLRSISVVEVAKALGIVLLSNNKAMCFAGHDKKTPSLSFNTRKNYWKCFGCGKGGDNIQLVIEVKNITFKQAVEWFRDNNIISHQNFDEKSKYLPKKIQRSFISHKTYNDSKIVKSDPEVYRWIINNSTLSEKSRTYLHKRGFKEETIEKFKIRDLFSANKFFSVLRERWGNKRLQRCGLLPLKDTKHKREYVKPAWWDYSLWFPFTSEDKIVYLQRRRFSANGPKYVNLY